MARTAAPGSKAFVPTRGALRAPRATISPWSTNSTFKRRSMATGMRGSMVEKYWRSVMSLTQ